MYCQNCGGGRVTIVPTPDGYVEEICQECKGSGLADHISIDAVQVGYAMKEKEEFILFELTGFPKTWMETGLKVLVGEQRLYIRLGRKLTKDGQPKDNRLSTSEREPGLKTPQENG